MIVKQEAHIIESTLEHLRKYISYWVISDTGSTDNTREIITGFFAKHKIPGKLVEHAWEDFGTNRTLALDACYSLRKHFDYIWVFDADDLISGQITFPKIKKNPRKNPDIFSVRFGSGFTYMRNQIFKATEEWKYVGVLHEFPSLKKNTRQPTIKTIEGNYYIDSRRLGDRSKAVDKYAKDAATLERGLIKEPKNERYMFYLGQSYFDAGNYEKSIYWYSKRVDQGKWFEEVYYSLYKIAEAKLKLGKDWSEVEKAYMTAWKYLPSRSEPLYEIAKHYREKEDFENAYK
jgi:glycosyltransferase involved in cell wall biosynthesis